MKFTYFCRPGRFLRTNEHYVFLGGWIHPPGMIILQHGTLSGVEVREIEKTGQIAIYEDAGGNYSYLEHWVPRADLMAYQRTQKIKVGVLRRKRYNLYIGMIRIYRRDYH